MTAAVWSEGLTIDRFNREVRIDGERVRLTYREFELLCYLAALPRRAVSLAELMREVGHDPGTGRRRVTSDSGHTCASAARQARPPLEGADHDPRSGLPLRSRRQRAVSGVTRRRARRLTSTGSRSAGPSAGRPTVVDSPSTSIPCPLRCTLRQVDTAGNIPAPAESLAPGHIVRDRRCPAAGRRPRAGTSRTRRRRPASASPSPRWCRKAARPVVGTVCMSTAARLARLEPPPRSHRVPTPPRR
jgi:hypothetical protein